MQNRYLKLSNHLAARVLKIGYFFRLEVPSSVAHDRHDEISSKKRKRILTHLNSSSENECNSKSEPDSDHSHNSDKVTKDTLSVSKTDDFTL